MVLFRTVLAATVLGAEAAAPLVSPPDTDFTRYAMTQGGLLVVVLVLLWGIRREMLGKDNQIAELTGLVKESTEAQTKATDALERLSRAVELLTERRVGR